MKKIYYKWMSDTKEGIKYAIGFIVILISITIITFFINICKKDFIMIVGGVLILIIITLLHVRGEIKYLKILSDFLKNKKTINNSEE